MDKIICDLCGTSYPDTASQCPICGTARTDASKQQSADMTADSYAYVRGGRFSKSNVRKRNSGQPERRQPGQVRNTQTKPTQPQEHKSRQTQPQEEEEGGSNRGLIIIVVVLLLAIIGMCAFIAMKFIDLSNAGGHDHSTGTQSTPVASQVQCTGVQIEPKELTFAASNKTILLQPTVTPANTTDPILYQSSDESVVKVDADGLVTPVATGEATILISCGEFSAEVKVACELDDPVPPETEPDATEPAPTEPEPTEPAPTEPVVNVTFSLNRVDFTLNGYGNTWNLTYDSEDAYGNNYSGPADASEITWTSEDPSVATVENGVVTAVGNGKTYVVAEYNGVTRKCIVRCVNVVVPGTEQTVVTEDVSDYTLNSEEYILDPGEQAADALKLLSASTGESVSGVSYLVQDEDVCTIDADGWITALAEAEGSTVIEVHYKEWIYYCKVHISAG